MTPRRGEIGAVVLAGGGSRRMGTSKALLDWHGAPLVARVAGLLARVADPVVIVAGNGQPLPEVPGAAVAIDAEPERGPLEGIAAGLRALEGRCDRVFVAATDQPLLHPAFVLAVVESLAGFEAAVPESDGRLHPLAAAYRPSMLTRAEQLLAAGERRATALATQPGTRRLPAAGLPHPESLRNANTPRDFARLLLEEPRVHVDGEPVLASYVGTLLDRLGPLPAGAALMLGADRVDGDRGLPLAEGDVLSVVPQGRERSASRT